MNKNTFKISALAVTMSLAVLSSQALASSNAPRVNLIPVTAVESIKQSSETAKSMESRLTLILEKVELQKSLYDNSKCEGALNDKGCEQIFNALSESYKEFLTGLNEELPNLSQQLNTTAKSIEKQLRKELGKGMTAVDIQRLVSGKRANGKTQVAARTRNNSYSMVKWLKNIGKTVSSGGYGAPTAVVASDIYVNMSLAHAEIEQIQMDINHSLATIDTHQAFGQLSPGQLETIASVKKMLFGEVDGESALPSEDIAAEPPEVYEFEQSL